MCGFAAGARRARAPCVAQILHACDVNTAVLLSLHDISEYFYYTCSGRRAARRAAVHWWTNEPIAIGDWFDLD